MNLQNDIAEYRQPDGLISPQKNPTPDSTGNGLSYLSLYQKLLERIGIITPLDIKSYYETVLSCQMKIKTGDWKEVSIPALFNRSITKVGDQNGFDDYVLIAWANQNMASLIWCMGNIRWWKFNNVDYNKFTWSSWFGWRPQVIAHFYWCATLRPNIFWRLGWVASIIFTSLFSLKDSTASVLGYAMVDAASKDKAWLVRLASKVFKNRFRKVWASDSLSWALQVYLGPQHPIALYWE